MSIIIRKTARAGICPACGSANIEYLQQEKSFGDSCRKYFRCQDCHREFEGYYQEVLISQSITIGETTHEIPVLEGRNLSMSKLIDNQEKLLRCASNVVVWWSNTKNLRMFTEELIDLEKIVNDIEGEQCAPASDTPSC